MEDNNLKNEVQAVLNKFPSQTFAVEEIADELGYHGANAFTLIVQTLAVLEREKTVIVTEEGNFKFNEENEKLEGIFHSNPKGFGFVNYDDDLDDAFIAPGNTMNAMNGDTVEIKIVRKGDQNSGKGPEGKIVDIIERNYEQVVGEFTRTDDDQGYIGQVKLKEKKLINYKFYVVGVGLKPTPGEVVTAEITEYPNEDHPDYMVGIAKEVIGSVDDPGIDILQIVYAHNIPSQFPEDVLQEADAIPEEISEEEMKGREDITDQDLVTIDGESSKDLDDAVTAWKLPNGNYHLGVHIADVSHYVKPGSLLDEEAYKRGTSVYLTDRVIPMLPRRLSNGICSLNEGQLRLCMSCDMEINPEGHVVKHRIHPSVMKSTARMTYKAVNDILESDDEKTKEKYSRLVPMFKTMGELHKILYKQRRRRGAIDFDDNEAEIIVDDNGHPIDIQVRVRGLAEKMIESFMLAANETVAKNYCQKHVPFIYRVHETPDGERVKNFFEFLSAFGIDIKGDPDHLKPKMLQNVLKKVAGKPEEAAVSVMMLRSLKQARYTDQPLGHFGLGAEYYTHFTSPIRRYPDTMVHRLIHHYEDNGMGKAAKEKYGNLLEEISVHSSKCERREVDAERDTDAMKKAEYMADHVGEEFDATVSSVLKFGMFIELPNTVEGLVHISRMKDDYYEYIEKFLALVGRNTHRTYRIGQPVRVKVVNVDVDQSAVDFDIVNPQDTPMSKLRPEHKNNGSRGGNRRNRRNGDKKGRGKFNGKRSNRNDNHKNNHRRSNHKR
ncbi:ribonuclease R [Apilactobacillus micheneri]|uniref:Ribonuclease R n=1 Tax=Apilactobacillus micheneri TaxID=1899430 RepID=A0A9Q8IMS1_9LACO|nr:ribonuclease R [Apilactobacillus micheneri]TPR39236.1 ribonuclease R [Apilactobacillus micheneri]TPR41352.1 ribonuclease R [Apilactobacillus micheneri]TPR43210.1 ribonuclease R [Apilactobacillus micheneri]TPR43994.1 ribonuclease R [Apilactobacillus micheneri]TPR44458.1 ribonuclease R [Apilactobacillus micheneri]